MKPTKTRTIQDLKAFARKKKGDCLSTVYTGTHDKYQWICAKKHTWFTTAKHVINAGTWCRVCAGLQKKTIEDMHKLAKQRQGKCLSTKYSGNKKPLLWQCVQGHEPFYLRPDSVVNGRWCKHCNISYKEEMCRANFEQLFNAKFPHFWPQWLRNERDNVMQLDGYNEKLKIAFEYNGAQHYKRQDFFQTSQIFLQRKEDDRRKKLICKRHGVNLISVPYSIDPKEMKDFILREARRLKLPIPASAKRKVIDFHSPLAINHLKAMKEFAEGRKGKCLADVFIKVKTEYPWKCENPEHPVWLEPWASVKKGHWCAKCYHEKRKSDS